MSNQRDGDAAPPDMVLPWSSLNRRPIPVTAEGAYIVALLARIRARIERDRASATAAASGERRP